MEAKCLWLAFSHEARPEIWQRALWVIENMIDNQCRSFFNCSLLINISQTAQQPLSHVQIGPHVSLCPLPVCDCVCLICQSIFLSLTWTGQLFICHPTVSNCNPHPTSQFSCITFWLSPHDSSANAEPTSDPTNLTIISDQIICSCLLREGMQRKTEGEGREQFESGPLFISPQTHFMTVKGGRTLMKKPGSNALQQTNHWPLSGVQTSTNWKNCELPRK